MQPYAETAVLDLMRRVWETGSERRDRTGVGTRALLGATLRFDLSDGSIPLLTTKRVFWKSAVKELIWFLGGETSIRPLVAQGVHIWTDWPLDKYRRETGEPISAEDFEARILAEQRAAQAKELQAERLAAAAERAQDSNALRMALAQMAAANRSSGGANADLDRQMKEMRLEQMRNPAPKPPDAATRKAIHEANIGVANIDRAIDLINERPSSLGTKYKVPGMEVVGQYTDPEGTSARAAVSNIGSLKLHDRSGAAVTIAEFPRLAPFIPGPGDKPEVAKKKLEGLKTEYQTIVDEWSSGINTSVLGGRKGADSKPAGKTIVREVKLKDGRTGVEYSDGTRGYK